MDENGINLAIALEQASINQGQMAEQHPSDWLPIHCKINSVM